MVKTFLFLLSWNRSCFNLCGLSRYASLYHCEEPTLHVALHLVYPLLVPVWHLLETCLTSSISVIKTLNNRDACDAHLVVGPCADHGPLATTLWVYPFFQVAFPISYFMPSDHQILSWIEEYHRRGICMESFLTKGLCEILHRKMLNSSERAGTKHTACESLPAPVSVAPQRQNSVLLPVLTDDWVSRLDNLIG